MLIKYFSSNFVIEDLLPIFKTTKLIFTLLLSSSILLIISKYDKYLEICSEMKSVGNMKIDYLGYDKILDFKDNLMDSYSMLDIVKAIEESKKEYKPHDPKRLEHYEEFEDGKGFRLLDGTVFEYDKYGGWYDEYDNYYDKDA